MAINWTRYSATDVGNRRSHNEDALVLRDDEGIWAVIDGLGGADAGNVASAAVAHALTHMAVPERLADCAEQWEDILFAVHDQLRDFASQLQPARMLGCTLAILRITEAWSLLLWVGDVRVYRWRQNTLTCLTEDHVEISAGSQNELTRLIGADVMLPDMAVLSVLPGDRYLLCSDGLHNELDDRRLAHWMARDLNLAQRELVAEALAAGGRDNLSLVLLDIEDAQQEAP